MHGFTATAQFKVYSPPCSFQSASVSKPRCLSWFFLCETFVFTFCNCCFSARRGREKVMVIAESRSSTQRAVAQQPPRRPTAKSTRPQGPTPSRKVRNVRLLKVFFYVKTHLSCSSGVRPTCVFSPEAEVLAEIGLAFAFPGCALQVAVSLNIPFLNYVSFFKANIRLAGHYDSVNKVVNPWLVVAKLPIQG